MPTIYTNCIECNYIPYYKIDSYINKYHNINIEKEKLLKSLGLPIEICIKIIMISNTLTECSNCYRKLCCEHTKIAIANGIHFNKKMICDLCVYWLSSI